MICVFLVDTSANPQQFDLDQVYSFHLWEDHRKCLVSVYLFEPFDKAIIGEGTLRERGGQREHGRGNEGPG